MPKRLFNPERYYEYPCPFIRECTPPLQALTMLRDFECLNIGLLSKQFISCDLWRVSKLIKYVRFSTVLKILPTRFFMLTKFLSFSYCKASQAAHVAQPLLKLYSSTRLCNSRKYPCSSHRKGGSVRQNIFFKKHDT